MKAIVSAKICPLMSLPDLHAELADEVMLGMEVTLLEPASQGFVLVETAYRYTGYAPVRCLLTEPAAVERWLRLPKRVVRQGLCDARSAPSVRAWPVAELTRGALVAPRGAPDGEGWVEVLLPDGAGYMKSGFLAEHRETPEHEHEDTLREALTRAALSYLGTAYRWGGKTPLGMDCSGLVSMSYMLNGILIYRDAVLKEGFPLRPIPPEARKPGDALYFPGHMAMYLGGGRFIHSTAKNGSDGVVVNSLDPGQPDFRGDLAASLRAVGSYF